MKSTRNQIGGIFLALIMTLYLGCVISLTHAHVINGVIVVHAHPDYWGNNSSPFTEHSRTELVFFHQVGDVSIPLDGLTPVQVPGVVACAVEHIFADFYSSLPSLFDGAHYGLRAPPASF